MTIDQQFDAPGDPERIAGVMAIIEQRRPIAGTRVLDLACRTGAFSLALANAGANVLGIEGKPGNYDRIPKHTGDVGSAAFLLDDVRNLADPRIGRHDVTLCLGLLYHLEAPDAVDLLRSMRAVTDGFAIIDTHIGHGIDTVTVEGETFEGHWYGEPVSLWSSIGNQRSWWFTPASLERAVRLAGWSNVERLPGIRWLGEPAGRHWLVIS